MRLLNRFPCTGMGYRLLSAALILLAGLSCKQGPKENTLEMEPVHDMDQIHQNISLDVHRVQVLEVLGSDKYTYLRVAENGDEYWMATGKVDARPGTYFRYNEALIKSDFHSEALDRTFETLYLVTRLIPDETGGELGKSKLSEALKNPDARVSDRSKTPEEPDALPQVPISELLANKTAFAGEWIAVKGTCVKVNPNIMGRNWVHLSEGSEGQEIVVTTQESVSEGESVRFAARVALDRDFGSGYSYPILMENGQLLSEL